MSVDIDLAALLEGVSPEQLEIAVDAEECERDLSVFYRRAWSVLDPSPYKHNWHVDAISDHLMAVSDGQIKKLLINVPFRTGKTLLCSVAWQAWTWAQAKKGPRSGPHVSFLCLSYASKLSLDNALTANRLIKSEWYQRRWGHRFQIAKDKDSNERFDSDKGGSRMSAGFDGSTLGRGGAIKLIDDPHKIQEVESDIVRESILKTYDEALSSRFTDPVESAEVTIMQRIGENDLSGHILEKGNVVHLMIPMEYEPARHCITFKDDGEPFWQDPRGADPETGEQYYGIDDDGKVIPGTPLAECEGECMWPERFPPDTLEALKDTLGPFSVAGQLQQAPAPRGGGIIKRDWWQPWRSKTFPDFGTVVASLDTALKEKESADYNALTIWGAFPDDKGHLQIMLKDAWRGRVSINTLVETVARYCRKHKVDVLLIEDKTRGHDTAAELRRMYGGSAWSTRLVNIKGDKVSRANAVAGLWSGTLRKDAKTGIETFGGGIIWAPVGEGAEYDWCEPVISEFESFPTGKHDDWVDSGTMAVQWMRTNGVALYRQEFDDEELAKKMFRRESKFIYDV